jgi:NAD(P)H dehydrogenase (quinone)
VIKMSIAVTGATGGLGSQVIAYLLKSLQSGEIIAVARDIKKAAPLAEMGVQVRYGDYDKPESLQAAFSGVTKLLFISSASWDNTQRIVQHANVVKAARDAKIGHIAYTGFAFAEKAPFPLANVHLATEYAILTTGIPYTFLRNGFYAHLFINEQLKQCASQGVIATNSGNGTINAAARDDYAHAAAVVLSGEGHQNKYYNLTYPKPWNFDDVAKITEKISGREVRHKNVSKDECREILLKAGNPEILAGTFTGIYEAAKDGAVSQSSSDLERLTGAVTPLETIIEQALFGRISVSP